MRFCALPERNNHSAEVAALGARQLHLSARSCDLSAYQTVTITTKSVITTKSMITMKSVI